MNREIYFQHNLHFNLRAVNNLFVKNIKSKKYKKDEDKEKKSKLRKDPGHFSVFLSLLRKACIELLVRTQRQWNCHRHVTQVSCHSVHGDDRGSERAPPGLTDHAKWAMHYDNCSGQSLTTLTACSALTLACPEALWPPKEHPSFGLCCRWRSSRRFHQPGTSGASPGQRGSSCPRHCCGMPSPLPFLPHPLTSLFFSVSQAKCPGVHVCFPGNTTETALSRILHSQDREVT